MNTNTLVSKTVRVTIRPVSSKLLAMTIYAAIVISMAILTSCGNGPGIRVGYRGAMVEIGGGRGGRPMMGGRDGYQQVQQRSAPHLTVGQRLGLEVFGNQPKHPTPGAQRTDWASVFGPNGPMINDKGSYALVEHVPVGLQVLRGPNNWTWKADCGNRILSGHRQPQQQMQRPYCPPERINYCPPPQMMVRPCPPPPCQPRLHFQQWGPQCGGYGYGGYQQRRMW